MADSLGVATTRPNARDRNKMEHADQVRELEFYRYYPQLSRTESALSRQPSPLPAETPPLSFNPSPTPIEVPRAAEDKALTAFAQLGALRLNARRCLISFFDRRHCYILAEATKSLSLHTGEPEFDSDQLCWGSTIFSKEASICYYTLNLEIQSGGLPFYHYRDLPSLIVNDLSKDPRFSHYATVIGPPYSRFYAGVPIRSPSGHAIGTYCVLDDKPRNGLSPHEVNFLCDMAMTVTRHLEMTRATEDYRRGKIMVKSLGSFAEGKSSLENWWQDPWEDTAPGQRPSTRNGPQESPALHRNYSTESCLTQSVTVTSPSTTHAPSATTTPLTDQIAVTAESESTNRTQNSFNGDSNDRVAPELRTAFTRAASMIVDATEAEGAVFFDAKISTFGGLVDEDFFADQLPEPDKPCVILGSALCKKTRDIGATQLTDHPMSESILKHLLRLYPHGNIFNLDDDLSSPAINSPSGGIELETQDGFPFTMSRKTESTRSMDDETYLKHVFPKARSLVLYPLWDPHRDRYFAASFIWTSDPMRVFTSEQELSYLSAFSNSVMAEVARLDTKLADAAKADFISSISHELRSPLHGILGMTDLLKDSCDIQQASHIATIETCGTTLLETINHVLDFAKINNLTRGASRRQKKRTQSTKHVISAGQAHTNDIMTLISDVNLSVLVEEVVDSVFAGFAYAKTSAQQYEISPSKSEAPPISLILDINYSDNYVFRTQPGAWRRVIMNLFGNALKYTPGGYIKVKLEVKRRPGVESECSEFRLTVTDSGIGMSENYINNRLFHSFAQENPLSQGTGLGLSIVKQIVESLGGEVEVRSEKGRGTKFAVSCPLKESSMSPTFCAHGQEQEKDAQWVKVSRRTKGLKVMLLGFDEEDRYFVESLKKKTKISLKALSELCTDWFGMENVSETTSISEADLIVATEARAKTLRTQYSQQDGTVFKAPVIVVCQGAASAQSNTETAITVPGIIFECIGQPVGPHKMARALSSCFDRHANRAAGQVVENERPTPVPAISQLNLKDTQKENMAPTLSSETLSPVLELIRPQLATANSAPEVQSAASSPRKKSTFAKPSRSLNCLCVDDNPINLKLLQSFVDRLGHRHVLAKNGLEAFNHYKAGHTSDGDNVNVNFDVVLMDINMPVMDGLEATRQIRAHEIKEGTSKVTIIALTGVADAEIQQEANSSGVNLFLIKPVGIRDLEVVLNGVATGQDKAKKEAEEERRRLKQEEAVIAMLDGTDGGVTISNISDAPQVQEVRKKGVEEQFHIGEQIAQEELPTMELETIKSTSFEAPPIISVQDMQQQPKSEITPVHGKPEELKTIEVHDFEPKAPSPHVSFATPGTDKINLDTQDTQHTQRTYPHIEVSTYDDQAPEGP